jgi:4-hydroxy-3-methylbut-2-enyl diphosphate reductase
MNTFSIAPSNFVMQSESAIFASPPRALKIIRAAHLGMCFGVRDAITLALEESRRQPLTILGELVHNESVESDLRARGIGIEEQVAAVRTTAVMITAHGASEKAMQRARSHGLHVLQATCPLVHYAHRAVQQLAREGFHPVIVGQRGHVEVRGLTEDLPQFDVVLTDEDVRQLQERPRFGVISQTTQPADRVCCLVESMRHFFPRSEVRYVDTICQPTKQRQTSAVDLARESDVVVVVGGAHSNNTRQLAATCRRYCERVHHVQSADDLRAGWFAAAATVGITAGTSTPDESIDAVEHWLQTTYETMASLFSTKSRTPA